jgi:hypothetical protein
MRGEFFVLGVPPAVLQLARQEVATSWVVMPIEAPICLFSYFFTDLILDVINVALSAKLQD